MVLPIPMKNLSEEISKQSQVARNVQTNPNVAPDPAMYCPRDLITPFGPAPYRIMLTLPVSLVRFCTCIPAGGRSLTKDEADDDAHS